jgi:hypothetical protein
MKRWSPIAYPGPGDSHRNFNQSTGERGSWLDGGGYQQILDELTAIVEFYGLTPSDVDSDQVLEVLRMHQPGGQCQLRYVSATSIRLAPMGGNRVRVAGKLVALPAAGVSAANTGVSINGVAGQNLAANTTYLVALGATGVLEFWTFATGHGPDATAGNIGVEIITGQTAKSLVGMVATNASSQFADSPAFRGVISWFNRRDIALIGTTTPGSSTSSIGYVELHGPSRIYFLTWADEACDFAVVGQANNNTTAFSVSAGVGVDGVFQGIAGGSYTASGGQNSFTAGFQRTTLTEGLRYITPMGTVGAGGTGAFSLAALATIRG